MKKIAIICLVGVCLLTLLVAPRALTDTGVDLQQASSLTQAGQYTQAEQLCLSILQREPNNPEAVYQAGKLLPRIYVATDRLPQAQEALQQLLARSASHELLPHALHEIAEQAKTLGKAQQARQLYEGILATQPEHPQALWLKMGAALANVYLGSDATAEAEVGDIVAQHSAEPWAAEALAQIGWAYDKLGQYGKARPLYEYVVDHWSDKPRAIHAHSALVRGCISLNDKPAAQTRLQQLMTRYASDSYLPNALGEIARGYREAQMYAEAKPVAQYVLDHYPTSDQRIWVQRDLVLSDFGLRNQEAAQAGLQKLVGDYAKDGHLPYVLNEIARTCRQGRMYEQARPLSQYILDNHPDSDQCIWAERDLLLCDVRQGNPDSAQTRLQRLASRYGSDGYLPYVLNEIAGEYRQVRRYGQAKTIAQYILDNYPNSDQCLWAQRDVVLNTLASGDLEAAAGGAQTLLSRFGTQAGAGMAIAEVAEAYGKRGQHEQARDLFRFNLTNYPASDDLIWSLRGFVNESIALNDAAAIEAGVKKLFSEYATSKNLPMAALHIGRELCKAGRTEAPELFQYIIDKYPNHEQTLLARVCLGHVYVQRGQDSQAETVYQQVLTDYANSPRLAEAVNVMAEGYFDQAEAETSKGAPQQAQQHYQAALTKWQMIVERLSASASTPHAYEFCGECYRKLNQPDKALECYQAVCRSWPQYEYAWHLQGLVAKLYQDMIRSGQATEAQAAPLIEGALTEIAAKHPDSPAAKMAKDWLQQIAAVRQGEPQ
jgi:tetratricopeptide (TPR) repeat protein